MITDAQLLCTEQGHDVGVYVVALIREVRWLRDILKRCDHGGDAEIDCPICGHCFDSHDDGCEYERAMLGLP
jgi:hypothetical protein